MPDNGRKAKSRQGTLAEKAENKQLELLDQLAQFEDFQKTILPALQADVKAGLTSEELRKKYTSLVQARILTTALANPDVKAALTAAKDILDRAEGTATQRIEQTHRLEKLPEEQLDAILKTELGLTDEPKDKLTH